MPRAQRVASALPPALLLVAVFVPGVLDGLYEGLALPPSDGLEYLASIFFILSLWSWFGSYCQSRRIPWPMDMGWFLVLLWPVLVPYYVFREERRRGWGLVGIYLVACLGAWGTGMALSIWLRLLVGGR